MLLRCWSETYNNTIKHAYSLANKATNYAQHRITCESSIDFHSTNCTAGCCHTPNIESQPTGNYRQSSTDHFAHVSNRRSRPTTLSYCLQPNYQLNTHTHTGAEHRQEYIAHHFTPVQRRWIPIANFNRASNFNCAGTHAILRLLNQLGIPNLLQQFTNTHAYLHEGVAVKILRIHWHTS